MFGLKQKRARRYQRQHWLVFLIILSAYTLFHSAYQQQEPVAAKNTPVWGNKPVLSHFIRNPDYANDLRAELNLSESQLRAIEQITGREETQIRALELESQVVIGDLELTIAQKSDWVVNSAYNQRLLTILRENQQLLRESLGSADYSRLVAWIESRWTAERERFTIKPHIGKGQGLLALSNRSQGSYPRSFEVYATRYDAGDRKIVALPDKCLKFANGGAMLCSAGYAYGQSYSVAISYKGKIVYSLVGESGPWNVDDNYWAKSSDPQPRRLFTDLPLGLPEAQAAFFNGYNGGLDQFGRVVTSPVAIDISRALAADLGLPSGNNLVTVSFLWTESWDSSQPAGTSPVETTAQPGSVLTAEPSRNSNSDIIRYATATPSPDGSILHEVQPGQTLTGIANVYGLTLQELLTLNGLKLDSVIHPGDRIIIRNPNPTKTSTVTLIASQTTPTLTLLVTRPQSAIPNPTITTNTLLTITTNPPIENTQYPIDWVLISIVLVVLLGLGLLLLGIISQRYR